MNSLPVTGRVAVATGATLVEVGLQGGLAGAGGAGAAITAEAKEARKMKVLASMLTCFTKVHLMLVGKGVDSMSE